MKFFKRAVLLLTAIIVLLSNVTFLYMRQAKFGKSPSGKRLELIKQSPNFKDGKFQNISHTPAFTEGYGFFKVFYEFLFKKIQGRIPSDSIPSVKTDLRHLPREQDVLVWFGHSSYFIQVDGKRMLVDPVFSGNASPVPGTTRSFKGSDRYSVDDLPAIDYLFISHDHYDHADYETLLQLRAKVGKVICGLGVGAHLEHWGYAPASIIEKDWHETVQLEEGFMVHTTPARHFSGRGLTRNNTLWLSYVLQTPGGLRLFIGGDGGYDEHFAEIGQKYGPFDLAILENGQYDIKWRYIHMLPEEVLQAAKDLNAKRLFPVHSSKFALANHTWDEPLRTITELNKTVQVPLVTPMIGELVDLNDEQQSFQQWWLHAK